jgi:phospholipid/cholesterol/gamma-HCH transport system substrate-binding protein
VLGLAALAVVVGGAAFVLLRTQGFSPGYSSLRSFTDDASGLMDGTQVRLNGIPIGYLEAQKLTRSLDLMRKVELDLKVKNEYLEKIPADSTVGLASDNLLGDLHIAIERGKSSEHIQAGAELRTTQAQDISKLMARVGQEMDRLQGISARIDKLLSEAGAGRGSMAKIANGPALQQANSISKQIDDLLNDAQHGNGTLAKLFFDDPLSVQLQSPTNRLNDIMGTVNHHAGQLKEFMGDVDRAKQEFQALMTEAKSGKGSLAKLDALQQSVDALSAKWNGTMSRLAEGQGTLGQLMVNPQMSDALDAAMRDVQVLAQGLKTNPKKFVSLRLF